MKRAASAVSNTGAGPPAQRAKMEESSEDEQDNTSFFLQHQNKVLAAELLRYKRTINDLNERYSKAQRSQQHFDATMSSVQRAWQQLDEDLRTVAEDILLAPADAPTATAGAGSSAGDASQSLYDALLVSTSQLTLVDATDAIALRLNGVTLPQHTDADDPDPLVPSADLSDDDGTEAANGALDAVVLAARLRRVDDALTQKLRLTHDIMSKVVGGLKRALTGSSSSSNSDSMQGKLLAQKRELAQQLSLMRDQLSLAQRKKQLMAREVKVARRDRHRVLRKLEQLAAEGVAIPEDNAPLANKPPVAGTPASNAAPTGQAHRHSMSGSPPDIKALLTEAGSTQHQQQQQRQQNQQSVAMTGVTCEHAADQEGSMSAQEAEALRTELAAAAEAADRRLAEADQLRRDKVELERELTRHSARSASAVAVAAAAVASSAGGPGGFGGLTPAPDDPAASLQQQLLRSPEGVRLQDSLRLERIVSERERNRAHAAERAAEEACIKVRQLEAAHPREMATQRARWEARVEESNVALRTVQLELDKVTTELNKTKAQAEKDISFLKQVEDYRKLEADTAEENRRLVGEAQRASSRAQLAVQALAKYREVEFDARKAAAEAKSDQAHKRTLEELKESRGMEEVLLAEVDSTAAALAEAKEHTKRLLQRQTGLEDANLQLTNDLLALKQQLEVHQHEINAHTFQSQLSKGAMANAEEYVRVSKTQMERLETELKAEREIVATTQKELAAEREAALRARHLADSHLAELKDLKTAQLTLVARCDDLAAREEAARAAEGRARELAATAQRRAERAKSSVSRLQAQLMGGPAPAAAAAAGAAAADTGSSDMAVEESVLQEEVQELRKVMRCSVCSARQKNCVITKCYHMFCRECVDQNLRTRHRKCPACGKGFGADDVHAIWLT